MTQTSPLKGKSILVTGGTGSFGRAFAKRVLEEDECERLIVFSRDEWKQWDMKRSDPIFAHPKIRYFLGDVRDLDRLNRAFHGVDLVVHAAALKQVPAAEYNPSEFLKTNVIGAMNVIDAAINCEVEKVIALSTDKACNPINLYGATKLCSDKLFTHGNVYVGPEGNPRFSVVRYGNVIGSRGSIIPLWKQMVKDGEKELPVTHPEMTRFWITLEQAVDFVVKNFTRMKGGEIFIPKIPSMKITDLAHAIAPNVKQRTIGIREGEKLHEMMISLEDSRSCLEFNDYYVILPQVEDKKAAEEKFSDSGKGKKLKNPFIYASDTNRDWFSIDDLKTMLKGLSNPSGTTLSKKHEN